MIELDRFDQKNNGIREKNVIFSLVLTRTIKSDIFGWKKAKILEYFILKLMYYVLCMTCFVAS